MAADAPDPAPVPHELIACLRALVRGWDTDDDGVTFFEALHDARLVLEALDAPENGNNHGTS